MLKGCEIGGKLVNLGRITVRSLQQGGVPQNRLEYFWGLIHLAMSNLRLRIKRGVNKETIKATIV